MQTDDLELKKLVYLYLINYAKTQPDLAIMGVNTFVKVSVALYSLSCYAQQIFVHTLALSYTTHTFYMYTGYRTHKILTP